jgi:antirestriction protein
MSDRRIYVACLAAYNSGTLHGAWIETALKDEDELSKEIQEKVLATSPYPNVEIDCPKCEGEEGHADCELCHGKGRVRASEEFAIHDHEGFPGGVIGEFTSMKDVAALEELLEEVGEDDQDAFMVYANDCVGGDIKDVTVEKFREAFRGRYDSEKAFAEEWAIETGAIDDQHPMFCYIDWEHYWTGCLQFDFYYKGGYVFDRNV